MTPFDHPVEFYDYDHSITSGAHPLGEPGRPLLIKEAKENAGYRLEGEWGYTEMWVHRDLGLPDAPEWPVIVESGVLGGLMMTVFCRDLVGGLDMATRWAQLETVTKLAHLIELIEEAPILNPTVTLGFGPALL